MNLTFLEAAIIKYFEAHPEVVERLIARLIERFVKALEENQ